MKQRAQFATRLGVIATTVGSAVGLGNIWRFPFEAGAHGGGAFLLIDLFFIFIVGVPVVCAEFIIGRHTGSNIRGAFRMLTSAKAWGTVGYLGLLASVMILSFYSVVAGWTMEYVWQSLTGFGGTDSVGELHERFNLFATSDWRPLGWTIAFLAINYLILARGVEKGIERMSNLMMPLLFIILIIFCINSLMMPKAADGLAFLFYPDFSQVTPKVVLSAMGQAFFSLSLGLGCLITYSSYFKKETPLLRTAGIMASLDTMVAILAGVVIFPAVFTFGMEAAAGPELVFETLPSIFSRMPLGMLWSVLFFILLFLASLSSTISMSEICIAYLTDEHGMSRRKATLINIGTATVFGSICALSFGSLSDLTICGMTVFSLFDFVSSNILLPIGGMAISVFVGWRMDKTVVRNELTPAKCSNISRIAVSAVIICLKYIAPVCIGLVFVFGLI